MRFHRRLALVLLSTVGLFAPGCSDDPGPTDRSDAGADASASRDSSVAVDAPPAPDSGADSGSPGIDAGDPGDAGPAVDAGVDAGSDSGVIGMDAGMDAGPGPVDSGVVGSDAGPVTCTDVGATLSLTSGMYLSCAVRGTCVAYCWGGNGSGEIGMGALPDTEGMFSEFPTPEEIAGGSLEWRFIAAGGQAACAITRTGEGYCWGDNTAQRLGLGTAAPSIAVPTPVLGGHTWTTIQTGNQHTCGIATDGSLWCWGSNLFGAPGLGSGVAGATEPTRVGTANDWIALDTHYGHTCGIRAPGTLWCWGANDQGQLGLGTEGSGAEAFAPAQVESDSDWASVTTGIFHTCGVRTDGSLWCWGANFMSALGTGTSMSTEKTPQRVGDGLDWIDVSAGMFHTCGVRADGKLNCWGMALYAGHGDVPEVTTPTAVGTDSDWVRVHASRYNSCALKSDGRVFCWGDGAAVGVPDRMDFAPAQVTFP